MKKIVIVFLLITIWNVMQAQIREYKIHDRGMLHQTVFNTGELGRGWMTGAEGNETSVPLMEWPSRSALILQGRRYSGQHNSIGAGMWLAANPDGLPGRANRDYSFCGAVGASGPEMSFGRWSFPYSIEKIENFPILANGELNPNYNPNEAEQKIVASWGTNLGIKVTRTSRAWSYPDYDDFIIYEYELEYTGDADGNPGTIEKTAILKDVLVGFVYGLGPSMYGYQRYYNEWKYNSGLYKGDQDQYWDSDYWLTFSLDRQTALDFLLGGKPEPDTALFERYARTGENGGGLTSPQAPGFAMLQFDTLHLAIIDKKNTAINESEYAASLRTQISGTDTLYYELDANKHLKQPFTNRTQTGDVNSTKNSDGELDPRTRTSSPYSSNSLPTGAPATWSPPYWKGRSAAQTTNTTFGVRKNLIFGPYTLRPGNKIHFAYAEVVGYGAQGGKAVEGGRDSVTGTGLKWSKAPSFDRKMKIGNKIIASYQKEYLDKYGYPDYVNSNVRNLQQVTHKAFEAYLGKDSTHVLPPVDPEASPRVGVYSLKMPPPAPAISLSNTDTGTVVVRWNRNAELFSAPNLSGPVVKYRVFRSNSPMGPWKELAQFSVGTQGTDNFYQFIDTDPIFKIGETGYYSVTSEDTNGKQSGRTNLTTFQKNIGAASKLTKVYAVPNPLILKSGFTGSGEVDDKIGFYGLPKRCTIRIFSFSGNLIETIEHDVNLFTEEWFQVTKNGQEIASGIYFYIVSTPSGESYSGKFAVIK